MRLLRSASKASSYVLVCTLLMVHAPFNAAQAAMVGTDTLIAEDVHVKNDRERLYTFLAREDVQTAMQVQGVSAIEAKHRVDSLSDVEVARIVGKLDQLPAGGNAVGAVVGAAVLIFLVLLFTDLLGLTDFFPFVRK